MNANEVPADGHAPPRTPIYAALVAQVKALEAERDKLRAALKPFADEAAKRPWLPPLMLLWHATDDHNIGGSGLTNGDLRRAAMALCPPPALAGEG
jgi:hypothetical protein